MDRLRRRIPYTEASDGSLGHAVAEILSVTGIRADVENALWACGERLGPEVQKWTSIVDIRVTARDGHVPVSGLIRADSHDRRQSARFAVREAIERLPDRCLSRSEFACSRRLLF